MTNWGSISSGTYCLIFLVIFGPIVSLSLSLYILPDHESSCSYVSFEKFTITGPNYIQALLRENNLFIPSSTNSLSNKRDRHMHVHTYTHTITIQLISDWPGRKVCWAINTFRVKADFAKLFVEHPNSVSFYSALQLAEPKRKEIRSSLSTEMIDFKWLPLLLKHRSHTQNSLLLICNLLELENHFNLNWKLAS